MLRQFNSLAKDWGDSTRLSRYLQIEAMYAMRHALCHYIFAQATPLHKFSPGMFQLRFRDVWWPWCGAVGAGRPVTPPGRYPRWDTAAGGSCGGIPGCSTQPPRSWYRGSSPRRRCSSPVESSTLGGLGFHWVGLEYRCCDTSRKYDFGVLQLNYISELWWL